MGPARTTRTQYVGQASRPVRIRSTCHWESSADVESGLLSIAGSSGAGWDPRGVADGLSGTDRHRLTDTPGAAVNPAGLQIRPGVPPYVGNADPTVARPFWQPNFAASVRLTDYELACAADGAAHTVTLITQALWGVGR